MTIKALFDYRLVGGSVPIRFAADAPIIESAPGFAALPSGLDPGFQYTVWSYSPTPAATASTRREMIPTL